MSDTVGAGALRYAGQRLGLIAVFACLLFTAAGTVDWPRGWAYVLVLLAVEVVTLVLFAVHAPAMLERRGRAGAGVERYDRVFTALYLAIAVVTPVVAGLDAVRYGWTELPSWLFFVGLAVLLPAETVGTWAMLVNEHFEQFGRIQADRGHRVVTNGPYAVVRHPGYLGAVAGAVVTPLMLGSGWTFVPAVLAAALFVVRTALEDRMLRRKLPGYEDYARRTHYRLVPGVW
jgi:protein-S-isoprenylcysteine O-methyltransferase Ste14